MNLRTLVGSLVATLALVTAAAAEDSQAPAADPTKAPSADHAAEDTAAPKEPVAPAVCFRLAPAEADLLDSYAAAVSTPKRPVDRSALLAAGARQVVAEARDWLRGREDQTLGARYRSLPPEQRREVLSLLGIDVVGDDEGNGEDAVGDPPTGG